MQRASAHASGGYASGIAAKMWPWLKNHSETDSETSASRSTVRRPNGLRQSTSPSRNSAQNESHNQGSLIFAPPNAPFVPRAIPHATWGPVNASVTSPLASSTVPFAISPAAPDHTFTVQSPRLYVASVWGFGGYRFSQSWTLGYARKRAITSALLQVRLRAERADGRPSGFVVVVVVPARAAGTSASAATAIAIVLSRGTTRACSR